MDIITLNFNMQSSVPLYEQLYDFIKKQIQDGTITSNTKLPSKRKLAKHLQISQNTIEAAYSQLIAEGYITSEPRKGFFVSKLEGILQLDIQSLNSIKDNKKSTVKFKYEFLSSRVDLDSFPYAIWRKIMKDLISEENKEVLQIGHSQGDWKLREAICDYLRFSRGVNSTPEQMVIGSGSEYLLQILVNLIGRRKVYAMENPGYFKVRKILKTHDVKVRGIPLDKQGLDITILNKEEADVTYITPSHQFPLGIIMPINRRLQLLSWASENEERYIIEDDYDSEFRFGGKPIPALQSLDTEGKVIYLGTFSKSLAPSMRIAYMVLPDKLLQKYRENFSFYACTVSRIEQQALYRFIKNGDFERHLNKMRNIYKKKREKLVSLIKIHLSNTEIIGTNAGLHLLLKVNNGMTEKELIDTASEVGIKILGISNSYDNKVRTEEPVIFMGYASLEEDDLEKAVILLKKVWINNM